MAHGERQVRATANEVVRSLALGPRIDSGDEVFCGLGKSQETERVSPSPQPRFYQERPSDL